jgi:hypothetical protein
VQIRLYVPSISDEPAVSDRSYTSFAGASIQEAEEVVNQNPVVQPRHPDPDMT